MTSNSPKRIQVDDATGQTVRGIHPMLGRWSVVTEATRQYERDVHLINTIDVHCTARVLVRALIAAQNHADPSAVY